MGYITNIDTLSALLDRLISENIKLHFFRKENVTDNIEHQENLIEEIKYYRLPTYKNILDISLHLNNLYLRTILILTKGLLQTTARLRPICFLKKKMLYQIFLIEQVS